jgi:hypothetical protein
MDDATLFQNKLNELTQALRQLEILYEQYFSGQEKRAPLKQRQHLEKQLRLLSNRKIIKTAHRFQFDNLSSRYYTYATNWDRMQRRMDEGRFTPSPDRKNNVTPYTAPQTAPNEELYRSLVEAHRACNLPTPPPGRKQFATFLDRQRKHLRERLGDRKVLFRVVIENGKPKLKARSSK